MTKDLYWTVRQYMDDVSNVNTNQYSGQWYTCFDVFHFHFKCIYLKHVYFKSCNIYFDTNININVI